MPYFKLIDEGMWCGYKRPWKYKFAGTTAQFREPSFSSVGERMWHGRKCVYILPVSQPRDVSEFAYDF